MAEAFDTGVTPRPRIAAKITEADLSMFNYIASQVFPPITDARRDGTIEMWNREDILRQRDADRVKMADGETYNRTKYGSTTTEFYCEKYGEENQITEEKVARYQNEPNPEFQASVKDGRQSRKVIEAVIEAECASKVMDTDTFNVVDVSGDNSGKDWDKSDATIMEDVATEIQRQKSITGIGPNAMICSGKIAQWMTHNDGIKGAIQDGTLTPERIRQNMAALFDLKYLLVGDATLNMANEGASSSDMEAVWDPTPDENTEYVQICRVAESSMDDEPCIGRQIIWDSMAGVEGWLVGSYAEPQTNSSVVQVRTYRDQKLLDSLLGGMLKVHSD